MAGVGRFEGIIIDVNDLDRGAAFWSVVTGLDFAAGTTPQYRTAVFPNTGLSNGGATGAGDEDRSEEPCARGHSRCEPG
jgi:predicted enzyme related to lactoylglutathione lyase